MFEAFYKQFTYPVAKVVYKLAGKITSRFREFYQKEEWHGKAPIHLENSIDRLIYVYVKVSNE